MTLALVLLYLFSMKYLTLAKNSFQMLCDRKRPYAMTVYTVFNVMSTINVNNIPTH